MGGYQGLGIGRWGRDVDVVLNSQERDPCGE